MSTVLICVNYCIVFNDDDMTDLQVMRAIKIADAIIIVLAKRYVHTSLI